MPKTGSKISVSFLEKCIDDMFDQILEEAQIEVLNKVSNVND